MNRLRVEGDVLLGVSDESDDCKSSLRKEDSSFLFWDGWGEEFFSSPSFVLYCLLLFTICLVLFKKGRTRCSDVVSGDVSLVVPHDVLGVVPRDVSGVVSNLYM